MNTKTAIEYIQLAWLLAADDLSLGPAVVEEIDGSAVVEESDGSAVVEEIDGSAVVEEIAGPAAVEEIAGPAAVELMVEVFEVEATHTFTASSPSHGGGLPASDIAKKSNRLVTSG